MVCFLKLTRRGAFALFATIFAMAINVSHQQASCGQVGQVSTSRIVGGNETGGNEYPWMAYLKISFWSGSSAECGGTLISDRWILTAAHCMHGSIHFLVTLGAHNVDSTHEMGRQQFNLTSRDITNHPAWYYGDVENDIALVRLPQPVVFSSVVSPACLPFSSDPDQVNDSVILSGWGNYSSAVDSGVSSVLRQVRSTVISTAECQSKANSGLFSGNNIICADGSQGNRYCYGDDGGPMNFYNPVWKSWFVIGVAHFGDSTTSCQSSRKPNLYARVRSYLNWIGDLTGIAPITSTTTTTTTTTPKPTTTRDPNYFDCYNKADGNYPNPASNCSTTFYMCSNGDAYLFTCAQAGTVYSPPLYACDWPANVAGCKASG